MRSALLVSSYLHFNALTSPSHEWVDAQMAQLGIDPKTYEEITLGRLVILAVFLIGIIVAELKSHRFYIAQTSEEAKFPYKPQRCQMTLWL